MSIESSHMLVRLYVRTYVCICVYPFNICSKKYDINHALVEKKNVFYYQAYKRRYAGDLGNPYIYIQTHTYGQILWAGRVRQDTQKHAPDNILVGRALTVASHYRQPFVQFYAHMYVCMYVHITPHVLTLRYIVLPAKHNVQ